MPPFTADSFLCLDIWADVHVQWLTSAVDKRDARCLLQPAISCQVWHWVSMILSTGAHIVRYIKHTHAHTHLTEMEPTWVVKLAACISGIDLFGIEPCHCCHLNFGLGAFSKSPSLLCHHTPPRPPIASPAPSSPEWKMDGTPTTDCSTSTRLCLPLPIKHRGAKFWRLPGKMSVVEGGGGGDKGQFYLTFANAHPSFHQALPLWNISLPLEPKPTGAKRRGSLLLKLPFYRMKYHRDVASQIEW